MSAELHDPEMLLAGTCDGGDCDRPAVSLTFDERLSSLVPVCRRHIPAYRVSSGLWQAEDEYAGLRFCRRSRFRWLAQWLLVLDQRAALRGRVSRGQNRLARRRDRRKTRRCGCGKAARTATTDAMFGEGRCAHCCEPPLRGEQP